MTKKKMIIIISCILLVLILGIGGYLLYTNQVVSTITLDINPSIEINIARNNKVKSVVAINSDAEEIISDDLKNITLEEAVEKITDNVIEKGYATDKELVILIHSEGNKVNMNEIVLDAFNKKNINPEVIEIKEITEENKKLAEQYNISPAKAAYIETVSKENENVSFEMLVEKVVEEIKETKETGRYCDIGYNLDGDFCIKEINRENADQGEVCPGGSYTKDDKCYYATVPHEIDELECDDGFKLSGTTCVGVRKMEASGNFTCASGTPIRRSEAKYRNYRDSGNRNEMVCEDTSKAVKAHLRCLDKPHIITGDGTCADGPKPTINGGCPNGDLLVGDGCYTRDPDNDNSDYVCPDGGIYKKKEIDLCPDTFKYTKASGEYTCPKDFKLNGTMCEKEETYDAPRKVTCDSGYTLEDNQCINYKKEVNKVPGFVCDKENSRVIGEYCVTYDIVDVKY